MPHVTECIQRFLSARRKDHNGPDLIDLWTSNMETQVNVSAGNGEPMDGMRSTWSDGVNKWYNIRIPKNAKTDPYFNDPEMSFPLEEHAEAIGCTGWDWANKRSRWLGFDFDSITGHAAGVGVSDEELENIKQIAMQLPYVQVRRSTGGRGLHLYVYFEGAGIPTANHDEHAALGRAILGEMSSVTGFDFAVHVDACGGNMWIWHRKMNADNLGLALIKGAEAKLDIEDLPTNWKDHVEVVTRRRSREDLSRFASDFPAVPLDSTHRADIQKLQENGHHAQWDGRCLLTHTAALAALHKAEGKRGSFSTTATGRIKGDYNCVAIPQPNGGWLVIRFGQPRETPHWQPTANGNLRAFFNPSNQGSPTVQSNTFPCRQPASLQIIELVTRRHELFHAADRIAYATASFGGHPETFRIADAAYRDLIAHECFVSFGSPPKKSHLMEALSVISTLALLGQTRDVAIRIARHGQDIYVDLANESRQYIRINATGWKLETESPILFIRPGGTKPMPVPVSGGSIQHLRRFVNLADHEWPLFVGAMVGALNPSGPYPIVSITGRPGSATSTVARFLKAMIDSSGGDHGEELCGEPSSIRDLTAIVANSWLVALDNLSGIKRCLSDVLCRLSTGGTVASRRLFTDHDCTRVSIKRPVVLTSVTDVIDREDLRSRTLFLNPPPISAIRTEAELDAEFRSLWPSLMGALFDAVATALKNLPSTAPLPDSRLADWTRWVLAAEPALGLEPGAFADAMKRNRGEISEPTLQTPFAQVVIRLADGDGFEGTATELEVALRALDSTDHPKSPAKLSGRLDEIANDLEAGGVVIERDRTSRKKTIRIRRRDNSVAAQVV